MKGKVPMNDFALHTEHTAPAASRPVLAAVQKQFGFVPNLVRVLAESPSAAEGYATLARLVDASSLDPRERHVVMQTVNLTNGCHYCVPAHAAVAARAGLGELDAALRSAAPLRDAKLEALRTFTRAVVERRGQVGDVDVAAFEAAGYSHASILDVLLAVAMKTLSNYANHIARTPIDAVFLGRAA
jgi:uncharacterized peroxidase-related enzyme